MKVTRKPEWLRVQLPGGDSHHRIKQTLRRRNLYTVCEEARCPNLGECWRSGTATLMVMGDVCTRGCRFCAVRSCNPKGWLDPLEPQKSAETVVAMGLNYVVITSVDRDDLPDGGAAHFADVIDAIHRARPSCLVEVLTPDFCGVARDIHRVLDAGPNVFAHNLETVRRLSRPIRDRRAGYQLSLDVLAEAKRYRPEMMTKSSLMLGFGETRDEVIESMRDLRGVDVDVLTLGQYLRPSRKHAPVAEYLDPAYFDELAHVAESLGFLYTAAGPLVRSSYKAGEFFIAHHLKGQIDPMEV